MTGAVVPTPRTAGFAMPAEWGPHDRTLMAWPSRPELWGPHLTAAARDYAEIARVIAHFEPVTMLAGDSELAAATAACGSTVDVLRMPADDSWVRDSGPVGVVRRSDGARAGVDFAFNGWGEKYRPYANDAALASRVLHRLGIEAYVAPIVLEGGSITVDGAGRLITTAQCLLHPTRNPHLDAAAIARVLEDYLGATEVIWLPTGLVEDLDTDGHVDNIAAFAPGGRVVAQTTSDTANPNHARLAENVRLLRYAKLDVVTIDHLPYAELDGTPLVVPYLNYYVVNGAVIVPTTGTDPGADRAAFEVIGSAYPGREVVGVPGTVLAYGGGGVHCITQQIPATAVSASASA